MNPSRTPSVRFKGYEDDWEERKFFESIASTIDFRGRTPKKLGMDWSDSGYLALSALNVKNGYIDPLADAHYGDEKLYRKWMSGRELKKGQVLFTTEAPMGNVAQVPDDNGYILSQRTVAFETKEDMMTNDFLAVLLKSPLVFNNLSALSSGGTAKGVSQKSLKGLSITVPLDIDEQQKIGSFFKQLDETIALHQRKLNLLNEQKKGFLQKMFPKNGEKIPEIRFAGFNDDWEERKLGELAKSFEYGLNASAKEFDGYHKYIRITDIDDCTHEFIQNKLTSPDVDFTNADNYILQRGDILFARTGASVGKSYYYKENDGLVYFAGFLIRARIKPEVSPKFVFQNTLTSKYNEFITITSQRSGQPGVNAEEYSNFKMMVPSFEEQEKIGTFFKQLDDTIALHQRKIDELKSMKKSMLQKMFV